MIVSVSCETCGLLTAVKPAEVCLTRVSSEVSFKGISWKQILKSELPWGLFLGGRRIPRQAENPNIASKLSPLRYLACFIVMFFIKLLLELLGCVYTRLFQRRYLLGGGGFLVVFRNLVEVFFDLTVFSHLHWVLCGGCGVWVVGNVCGFCFHCEWGLPGFWPPCRRLICWVVVTYWSPYVSSPLLKS